MNQSMPDRFLIGVTGHRHLRGGAKFVVTTLQRVLARLRQAHPEDLVALSALAEGADTCFAEEALALSIPLEAVIPFEGYSEDFPPGLARERFERLLAQACAVHRLPYNARSDEAYLAAGLWITDHSDLLIAVWDEQPARGKGGTGDVVQYARSIGRPLVLINPVSQRMTETYTLREISDG